MDELGTADGQEAEAQRGRGGGEGLAVGEAEHLSGGRRGGVVDHVGLGRVDHVSGIGADDGRGAVDEVLGGGGVNQVGVGAEDRRSCGNDGGGGGGHNGADGRGGVVGVGLAVVSHLGLFFFLGFITGFDHLDFLGSGGGGHEGGGLGNDGGGGGGGRVEGGADINGDGSGFAVVSHRGLESALLADGVLDDAAATIGIVNGVRADDVVSLTCLRAGFGVSGPGVSDLVAEVVVGLSVLNDDLFLDNGGDSPDDGSGDGGVMNGVRHDGGGGGPDHGSGDGGVMMDGVRHDGGSGSSSDNGSGGMVDGVSSKGSIVRHVGGVRGVRHGGGRRGDGADDLAGGSDGPHDGGGGSDGVAGVGRVMGVRSGFHGPDHGGGGQVVSEVRHDGGGHGHGPEDAGAGRKGVDELLGSGGREGRADEEGQGENLRSWKDISVYCITTVELLVGLI